MQLFSSAIAREDAKYLRGLVEQEDAKQKRNARFKSGDAYTETSSQTLNSFKAVSISCLGWSHADRAI